MSKEYFSALQKNEEYSKENQLYLKKRGLNTNQNLIKTFFNKNIKKGEFILDLGTADGTFVEVAKENGFQSSGLDIDQVNLENQSIDIKTETCDMVVANSLIEHIQNPTNFLREVKRVLKKNAFFILITPDWKLNIDNFNISVVSKKKLSSAQLKNIIDVVSANCESNELISISQNSDGTNINLFSKFKDLKDIEKLDKDLQNKFPKLEFILLRENSNVI